MTQPDAVATAPVPHRLSPPRLYLGADLKKRFKFESSALLQERLPEIAHPLDSCRYVVDAKVINPQPTLKLAPLDRR